MFWKVAFILNTLLMSIDARAGDVPFPKIPPPRYGMATIDETGTISIEHAVFKYVVERKFREFTVVVTQLGDGMPVHRNETRTKTINVMKPVSETRIVKFGKEDFQVIQVGQVLNLAEHPRVFLAPTPVLLANYLDYRGRRLEPFYMQFVAKEAYVVSVLADKPKVGESSPAHVVEASRDADLTQLQDLELFDELHLRGDGITDGGLQKLGTHDQLKRLHVSSRSVTDEGLKFVARLKNLEFLDLSGTKVTDAAVAELKKALPRCRIQR